MALDSTPEAFLAAGNAATLQRVLGLHLLTSRRTSAELATFAARSTRQRTYLRELRTCMKMWGRACVHMHVHAGPAPLRARPGRLVVASQPARMVQREHLCTPVCARAAGSSCVCLLLTTLAHSCMLLLPLAGFSLC